MLGLEDKRITQGWFSKKHKTSEAHIKAQQAREEREQDAEALRVANIRSRAKRSNAQQIKLLDQRPGKGVGAKRERKRLGKS